MSSVANPSAAARSRRLLRLVVGALVLLLLLAVAALAQTAMDRSLSAQDGRVNPRRPKPVMAKPLYTVNRNLGVMQHDRANAFNDPAYRFYRPHARGRFDRFSPSRTSSLTAGFATPRVSYIGGRTLAAPGRVNLARPPGLRSRPARRSSHLAMPTYRAGVSRVPRGRVNTLRAPTYHVGARRR